MKSATAERIAKENGTAGPCDHAKKLAASQADVRLTQTHWSWPGGGDLALPCVLCPLASRLRALFARALVTQNVRFSHAPQHKCRSVVPRKARRLLGCPHVVSFCRLRIGFTPSAVSPLARITRSPLSRVSLLAKFFTRCSVATKKKMKILVFYP